MGGETAVVGAVTRERAAALGLIMAAARTHVPRAAVQPLALLPALGHHVVRLAVGGPGGRQLVAKTRDGGPGAAAQAADMRWLAVRLRVPQAVAHRGVLLTAAVEGEPLGMLLGRRPEETAAALERVLTEVAQVSRGRREGRYHRAPVGSLRLPWERRYAGAVATRALRVLGARVLPSPEQRAVVRQLGLAAGAVLRRTAGPLLERPRVLTYGALTPEHVLLTDGEPVFLSPALRRAPAVEDLARLVTRVLVLAATRLPSRAYGGVIDGVHDLVARQAGAHPGRDGVLWLADLLDLVVRDAMLHLAACLSPLPGLPAPDTALAVTRRAVPLARWIATTAAHTAPAAVRWERALGQLAEVRP